MTECNHEAFSFSNCRKRQVRGNFAGGSISSNGGALLLREVDRRLGLTARVARALGDRRQRGKVRHEVVTMVRQRVHAIALGYEDLNDHDALRDDPVVQTACDRDASLASSSTLCRFEQRAQHQWAIAIHQELLERFIASFAHPPMRRAQAHRDERPVAPARRAPACRPRWSLARRGASKPGSVSPRARRSARLVRPARDAEVPRLSSAAWRRGRATPSPACNEPRGERGREGRACKEAGRSGVRQVGGVPGTPSAWRSGLCA